MKVVHVTSSLVKKAAGVREVVLGLARAQSAAGLDVSVFGLEHSDWAAEANEWGSVPTRIFPVRGPRRLGYAPSMTSELVDASPDIVHLHGLWMHPGRSVLQWHRYSKRPFIVSPHGMLSQTALSYGRLKKSLASSWFQSAVLSSAGGFAATSTKELSEIRAYGIDAPAIVVPNGVHVLAPLEEVRTERRVVLSLGRIHPIKGLDQLVEAWASLERDFPEWSVQIVGPDADGEATRLRSLIQLHRLKRIEILPPVFGAKKSNVMANAAIFALPSHSENFAVTVAESLMLGVPVVASHGAPWSGLDTNACGLWVPLGGKNLENGLRKLMSISDRERNAMGARGREWMLRDFTWPTVSERLRNYYDEVIEKSL